MHLYLGISELTGKDTGLKETPVKGPKGEGGGYYEISNSTRENRTRPPESVAGIQSISDTVCEENDDRIFGKTPSAF